MPEQLEYTAVATASAGEQPRVATNDGALDLTLTTPSELGGKGGEGANAEQLLAAGYAACLLSALRYVAAMRGEVLPPDCSVTATVEVGLRDQHRFGAEVTVQGRCPSMGDRFAELLRSAQDVWPYAGARIGGEEIRIGTGGGGAPSQSEPRSFDPVREVRAESVEGRGYGG